METLITVLVFAARQIVEHQDVVGLAVAIGGVLAGAFSLYRRYVVTRELAAAGAALLDGLDDDPAPRLGGSAAGRSEFTAATAGGRPAPGKTARQRVLSGFWQNFLFFALGSLTSLLLQGLT